MKIIAHEITRGVLFQVLVAVFSAGGFWISGNCQEILGDGKQKKGVITR